MALSIAQPTGMRLSVPKTTGTHGDTLIAWGLAIFVSELLGDQEVVLLSDGGYCYHIDVQLSSAELERAISNFTLPLARSRLKWLESEQNSRIAPAGFDSNSKVDRDKARDVYRLWRESRRALQPMRLDTWWRPTSKEYYCAPDEAHMAGAPGFPAG